MDRQRNEGYPPDEIRTMLSPKKRGTGIGKRLGREWFAVAPNLGLRRLVSPDFDADAGPILFEAPAFTIGSAGGLRH